MCVCVRNPAGSAPSAVLSQDPPKEGVALAVLKAQRAGVKVVMVTGPGSQRALAAPRLVSATVFRALVGGATSHRGRSAGGMTTAARSLREAVGVDPLLITSPRTPLGSADFPFVARVLVGSAVRSAC